MRFRERPDACVCCNGESWAEGALDFHHWVYEPEEIGCYLCRACHMFIHTGKGRVRSKKSLRWASRLNGAVDQLVQLHFKYNDSDVDIEYMLERYNMPKRYNYDWHVDGALMSNLDEYEPEMG